MQSGSNGLLVGALTVTLSAMSFLSAGRANATVWNIGDLTTYTSGSWGDDLAGTPQGPGATLLAAKYGIVTVGTTSGHTMRFSDASSVLAYMPAIGPFGPLNANVLDPITNVSGGFGGEVLGLELNVDFSDAGFLPGTSGVAFGDLILANMTANLTALNGLTVRQVLDDVNTLLGGGSSIITIADLGSTVGDLNASFSVGLPSQFAQDHLVAADVASATPLPASFPLFATGIGLLGIFGSRRKKRAAARVA
jgi:hypothetical protein